MSFAHRTWWPGGSGCSTRARTHSEQLDFRRNLSQVVGPNRGFVPSGTASGSSCGGLDQAFARHNRAPPAGSRAPGLPPLPVPESE